jgi:hypothetical protein
MNSTWVAPDQEDKEIDAALELQPISIRLQKKRFA